MKIWIRLVFYAHGTAAAYSILGAICDSWRGVPPVFHLGPEAAGVLLALAILFPLIAILSLSAPTLVVVERCEDKVKNLGRDLIFKQHVTSIPPIKSKLQKTSAAKFRITILPGSPANHIAQAIPPAAWIHKEFTLAELNLEYSVIKSCENRQQAQERKTQQKGMRTEIPEAEDAEPRKGKPRENGEKAVLGESHD